MKWGGDCFYEPHKLPSEPDKVFIGNNVNIASDVAIYNHDVIAYMINKMGISEHIQVHRGEVHIGNNVFIGGRSIILYDVNIGNNVIVAAGSVVNKNIPDGSVVAGVPAKIVGNFDESVKRYIDREIKNN